MNEMSIPIGFRIICISQFSFIKMKNVIVYKTIKSLKGKLNCQATM